MSKVRTFLVSIGLLAASAVQAQETGYIWSVDRQTIVINDKRGWVVVGEAELKVFDAETARVSGRVDLPYQASSSKLEILEAVTLKSDGRRLVVAPDNIIDIAPRMAPEVTLYTDIRTRSIVFPDVGAGDSIRYVYRLTTVSDLWPGVSWTMARQNASRTKFVERIFEYPSELGLNTEHHDVEYRVENLGDRVRKTFAWRNEKPEPAEVGTTASIDWSPRFSISTFKSHAEIGDHYGKLHVASAAVTPVVAELAKQIVGSVTDRATQARLLYAWATQNVRYVGVPLSQGTLTPRPAEQTLKDRYGDCRAYVALMASLLAAKGIASEPVLINGLTPRYVLPAVAVSDFEHVILFVPELDLYIEPTAQYAAFGVLPWGYYDKPVLHAVEGKSRVARIPRLRAEDNVTEVKTVVTIASDGRISGKTREHATGSFAIDLKAQIPLDTEEGNAARARALLRNWGLPGSGKWIVPKRDNVAPDATLEGEFKSVDAVDLAAGEGLFPSNGLRVLPLPGTFLVGGHDGTRTHPFPCYAGRQVDAIEVTVPAGLKPTRLPANRQWSTSIAEYRSSYEFKGTTLYVRREFVARPQGQVCGPDQSRELIGLMSNIRRDYRAVVVFDKSS